MRRRRRDRRRGDMRGDYRDMRHEYTYYPENSDYRRRDRRDYAGQMSDYRGDYRGGDYRGDYRGGDYASDYKLSDDELMDWSKDLLDMVEPKDKYYFTKENIERKMRDMGMDSEKDFSFSDLYTAALMMYTDYHKSLGTSNMDTYIRMAKDFLCDEDAELKGGEKLAAYYDNIVEGM